MSLMNTLLKSSICSLSTRLTNRLFTLVLLCACNISSVSASDSCQTTNDTSLESIDVKTNQQCIEEDTFHFGLSLGLGMVTNPLYQSSNIPLLLLPSVSYYSGNFFLENLDLGYFVQHDQQSSIALIATPSYDSIFFNRWDPGNIFVELSAVNGDSVAPPFSGGQPSDHETLISADELSTRRFSYLAGVEYAYEWQKQQIQISALSDITNTHSGTELRFAYQYRVSASFLTTLGFTWKDKNLTDYYYGVKANEIVDDRAEYTASSSFNPFVRATYKKQLDDGNSLRASIQFQQLDSQISLSPVVEHSSVITFFVGRTFSF
jgi:MipA family protein